MEFGDVAWSHTVTVIVTTTVVVGCVLFHYEGLSIFGRWLKTDVLTHRARIAALIFGELGLHIMEIWLFALAYYLLLSQAGFGDVLPLQPALASQAPGFLDLVYFSTVTYTTVGFGDFVPTGAIRFLTGMEALLGFVLLTWSASFTFLEMQRYWGRD